MTALILDESKWLFFSMLLALIVVAAASARRRSGWPSRSETLRALNLFYGCTIGTMALGHLLAVTVKAGQGSLNGSPPWILYPLGLVLAIPAWWLAIGAGRSGGEDPRSRTRTLALNSWLAVCLFALGIHNLPLAAPAILNISYQLHGREAVGRRILALTLALYLALLAGSLWFAASGQSFEELQGVR